MAYIGEIKKRVQGFGEEIRSMKEAVGKTAMNLRFPLNSRNFFVSSGTFGFSRTVDLVR